MKIGILASGNDMLSLFSFLHRYDHEYIVWYDDLFGFRGDKPVDAVFDRVKLGLKFLETKGVDMVIVPPIIELCFQSGMFDCASKIPLMPLFQSYLHNYCFAYSLVGKIGFMGDGLDLLLGQEQLENLAKTYVLTDNQRAIKKFHFPFVWWGKEIRHWKYFFDAFSWSNPLVHTLIKHDIRYFKDAGVDTLIPLNYCCFHAEKTIKKTINFKHMRFHSLTHLENLFVSLVGENQSYNYHVSVYATGHGDFLMKQKRLVWLLGRGKDTGKLQFELI